MKLEFDIEFIVGTTWAFQIDEDISFAEGT